MSNALYGGTCWARVDVLTAPQGRLDAAGGAGGQQ